MNSSVWVNNVGDEDDYRNKTNCTSVVLRGDLQTARINSACSKTLPFYCLRGTCYWIGEELFIIPTSNHDFSRCCHTIYVFASFILLKFHEIHLNGTFVFAIFIKYLFDIHVVAIDELVMPWRFDNFSIR